RLRSRRSRIALAANHLFNPSFTVRSGTTRVRHRTMAGFTSARSGARSPCSKPMRPLGRATNSQPHAFSASCGGACVERAADALHCPGTREEEKLRNRKSDFGFFLFYFEIRKPGPVQTP